MSNIELVLLVCTGQDNCTDCWVEVLAAAAARLLGVSWCAVTSDHSARTSYHSSYTWMACLPCVSCSDVWAHHYGQTSTGSRPTNTSTAFLLQQRA